MWVCWLLVFVIWWLMLLEFGFEMLLFLVGLVVMDSVCCCLRWA